MNRVDDELMGSRGGGRYVTDFGIPYIADGVFSFPWPCWEFFREDVDSDRVLDIVN